MSCDFAVWYARTRPSAEEAQALYGKLCEGDVSGVEPHPGIDAFYAALTSKHPEIDDVPEERVDDTDLCPWSVAFDRSPGHLIMCSVWSKANYVEGLIRQLASEHGLVVYDPQSQVVHCPESLSNPAGPSRPWWKRFWS